MWASTPTPCTPSLEKPQNLGSKELLWTNNTGNKLSEVQTPSGQQCCFGTPGGYFRMMETLLPAAWGLRTLFSLWQKDGHKQDSAVTNTTGRWCISANGTFCRYREAAPASSCPAENLAASRRCNRDPRTFGRCTTQEGCFQFDLPSISYKEPIVSTTLHHKPSTHQDWAWGRLNNPCQVTRGDHIVACDVLLQRYNNRELA